MNGSQNVMLNNFVLVKGTWRYFYLFIRETVEWSKYGEKYFMFFFYIDMIYF